MGVDPQPRPGAPAHSEPSRRGEPPTGACEDIQHLLRGTGLAGYLRRPSGSSRCQAQKLPAARLAIGGGATDRLLLVEGV